MKKRLFFHTSYWALVLLGLTLFFGSHWENHLLAFYFSSLLLPVVMGTSYFFNLYLVPNFLFTEKYGRFALYFFYMLVISLYLEMLVCLLSFVALANYQVGIMRLETMSIFMMGINMYLVVFITSFIRLAVQFRKETLKVRSLKTDMEKRQKATIQIRADRKNHQITLDELYYIESLNDFVKVVSEGTELTAREKITRLHERLPDHFVRIHRSFVVNRDLIQSFSKTQVLINDVSLPIGRTYKKEVIELFQNSELPSQ